MPLPAGALNGRIPLTALARLGWDEADHLYLEEDAAASLTRLAAWFAHDNGQPLLVTDAYRTLDVQVRLKAQKGPFAATPGTSNHGWGRAVDLSSRINVDGSPEHRWMETNGPRFGWINPPWAVDFDPTNGQHEPWHWEYRPLLDTHPAPPPEDPMGALTNDEQRELLNRLRNLDRQITGADDFAPSVAGRVIGLESATNTVLQSLSQRLDDIGQQVTGLADVAVRGNDLLMGEVRGVPQAFASVQANIDATRDEVLRAIGGLA